MKKIDVSNITTSVAMPIKSGTLQFLQDAYKESLNSVISNLVDNPQTDTIYILSGCVNTGTLPVHNISPGVLYVNGEVYDFAGATFTLSGLQKAYARIETTQYTTNADPVEFTDGVERNVHNVRKIVIENTTTSSSLPEFKDFVYAGKYFKGETKEIVMAAPEYTIKFNGTGLGLLEYKGWAVMNGNNGTHNDNGKTVIAYGSSYATLEATGGEATHVLTEAELPATDIKSRLENNGTDGAQNGKMFYNASGDGTDLGLQTIASFGSGTAHNNMQPYVVRLRIQKI